MQISLTSSFFHLLSLGLLNLVTFGFGKQTSGLRFAIPSSQLSSSYPLYIHNKFLLSLYEALVKHQSNVVIAGPENVGKTVLVTHLVNHWNMKEFQNIIWINATNENSVQDNLNKLEEQLKISHKPNNQKTESSPQNLFEPPFDLATLVQEISLQLDGRTLLIFDNMTFDLANKILPTLSKSEKELKPTLQILVTTRDSKQSHIKKWGDLDLTFTVLPLNPMTRDDLVKIISSYLDFEPDSNNKVNTQIDELVQLSSILMDQVNGEGQSQGQGHNQNQGGQYFPITPTLDFIRKEALICVEEEVDLNYNKCVLRVIANYIGALREESKWAELKRIDAQSTQLAKMAIEAITHNDFEQALHLKRRSYELALERIPLLTPGPERDNGEKAAIVVLNQIADCNLMLRDFEAARILYEKVEEYRARKFGGKDVETLETRHSLAIVLLNLNQPAKALPVLQSVYEARKEVLGPEHEQTLSTLSVFASLLSQSEVTDYQKQALELFQFIHRVQEKELGEEDPESLETLSKIARLQLPLGEYDKALESYTKLYAIRRSLLGLEHKDTVVALDGISGSLTLLGDNKRALPIQKQVYELCKKVYGPADPQTLKALSGLSLGLSGENLFDQALKLNEHVIETLRQTEGEDSQHTKDVIKIQERILQQKKAIAKEEL